MLHIYFIYGVIKGWSGFIYKITFSFYTYSTVGKYGFVWKYQLTVGYCYLHIDLIVIGNIHICTSISYHGYIITVVIYTPGLNWRENNLTNHRSAENSFDDYIGGDAQLKPTVNNSELLYNSFDVPQRTKIPISSGVAQEAFSFARTYPRGVYDDSEISRMSKWVNDYYTMKTESATNHHL